MLKYAILIWQSFSLLKRKDTFSYVCNDENGYHHFVSRIFPAFFPAATTELNTIWQTTVPQGALGQIKRVVATAADLNGLKSDPCTLLVKFGLFSPLDMVSISGGTFQMGSSFQSPIREVTLSPYNISSTEVTQELYDIIMRKRPALFDSGMQWPVERVSWYDAALFCNALSKKSGLDTVYIYNRSIGSSVVINYAKNGYRLPTEMEFILLMHKPTQRDLTQDLQIV